MDNSTLTPSKATAMQNEALNPICDKCNTDIQDACNTFIEKIKQVWEDQYACEYMDSFKTTIDSIINELSENNKVFSDTLASACGGYATVGNMGEVYEGVPNEYETFLNFSSDEFKTFEDGETFGFKGGDLGSVDEVGQAFSDCADSINGSVSEVQTKVSDEKAFGVEDINTKFGESAGKLVNIVKEKMDNLKTGLDEQLNATKSAYASADDASKNSATIEVDGSGQ